MNNVVVKISRLINSTGRQSKVLKKSSFYLSVFLVIMLGATSYIKDEKGVLSKGSPNASIGMNQFNTQLDKLKLESKAEINIKIPTRGIMLACCDAAGAWEGGTIGQKVGTYFGNPFAEAGFGALCGGMVASWSASRFSRIQENPTVIIGQSGHREIDSVRYYHNAILNEIVNEYGEMANVIEKSQDTVVLTANMIREMLVGNYIITNSNNREYFVNTFEYYMIEIHRDYNKIRSFDQLVVKSEEIENESAIPNIKVIEFLSENDRTNQEIRTYIDDVNLLIENSELERNEKITLFTFTITLRNSYILWQSYAC